MPDDVLIRELPALQGIVPAAVQDVIKDFAKRAVPASQMLKSFTGGVKGKVLQYVYEDGSFGNQQRAQSSVTTAAICEYALRDPKHPEELPATVGGFTFADLLSYLKQLDGYLFKGSREHPDYYPDYDDRKRWDNHLERIRFGTNPEERSSRDALYESISVATDLVEYIIDLQKKLGEKGEVVEEEVTPPIVQETVVETPPVTAGTPNVFGYRSPEDEERPQREPQTPQAPPQAPAGADPRNFLREMAAGDAAFHKEIIRMEVMLSNQVTEIYAKNLDTKNKTQFQQSIQPYIGPLLYFELQKLNPDQLAGALRSPKDRLNIYLNALLRLQQDPSFRAQLALAIDRTSKQRQKPEEKDQKAKTAEESQKEEKLVKELKPKEIAGAIEVLETNAGSTFLSDEEIVAASRLQATPTTTLADQIRFLLGKDGAGLVESDVRSIILRLQTLAITRANVHRLTESQFQEIFTPVFNNQNSIVFDRIQRYFKNENLDWTRLFSAYIQSSRVRNFTLTHNPATLLMPKDIQPQMREVNYWNRVVSDKGDVAVAEALYEDAGTLEKQRQELGTAGAIGGDNPELTAILGALSIKHETSASLGRLAALNPIQQRAVLQSLGHSLKDTVYLAPRIDAALEFFEKLAALQNPTPAGQAAGGVTAQAFEITYDIYIAPPPSLTGEIVEGEFIPSSPLFNLQDFSRFVNLPGFEELAAAEAAGAPQEQKMMIAGRSVERWVGLGALALITGGESAAVVEKVEKVQQIIGFIPGGQVVNGLIDKYGWETIDKLGKSVIFAAIAALIAGILQFVAMVIFWLNFFRAAHAIITAVSNLLKNFGSWAKTFVSKTVLPTLSRLASGLGHALSSLGPSALGAITSITSASVFSGGLLASLTAGVMLTSTTTLTNLNGAFQTNVSGSFSTAPHGTGAPNVGCYQFVSDPAQLKAFANQTGTSTKAFTPAEEQMVAVAGGIQFSYPTLTGKLCGPDMTSRPVKLIRASGRTWGGWTISADAVILYDEGILNQDDLDYTLWHEAGHIMDARNSGLLQSYAASYSGGRFETYPLYILPGICSPFVPLSEAFAETITVYLMNIHHPNWPYPCAGGVYNLQTRRPHEYSWVQQNIYH